MARLMSQIKGGYYAAAPEAVAAVLQRLRPPQQGECLLIDPCAGAGFALLQLAAMPRGNSVCSMADPLALVAIEFIRQSFMADEGME